MPGCSCEVYEIQTLLGPLSYQKSNYGLGRYWMECLTSLYAARIPTSAPRKSRVVDHTCNPSTGGGGDGARWMSSRSFILCSIVSWRPMGYVRPCLLWACGGLERWQADKSICSSCRVLCPALSIHIVASNYP